MIHRLTNLSVSVYAVPMISREQMQNTLVERLFWHTRNETMLRWPIIFTIVKKWTPFIPGRSDAVRFLLSLLARDRSLSSFRRARPETQKRENIPFLQFVLVYLMRVIGSIPKMEPVWDFCSRMNF